MSPRWSEAIEACREAGLETLAQALEKLDTRWQNQTFHLAVLGQFKRGKSSLINALLGPAVLPVGVLPLTAIPTFIRYGAATLQVAYLDGRQEAAVLDELSTFATEKRNPDNRLGVERVDVAVPVDWLATGCVILDTPGIGSTLEHNTATTFALLPECDAALLVVSPDPPITQVELQFFRQVLGQVRQVYVVLNKIDLVDESDRQELVDALTSTARQLGLSGTVWQVSGRTGSGVSELRTELVRFFRDDGRAAFEQAMTRRFERMVGEGAAALRLQVQAAGMPVEVWDRRLAEFRSLQKRVAVERRALVDRLRGDRTGYVQDLRQQAAELARGCWQDLEGALRGREPELSRLSAAECKTAVQESADMRMAAWFEGRRDAWLSAAEEGARQVVEPARSQAVELLQSVAHAVSGLLGAPITADDLPEAPPLKRSFLWQTERWHGAVGGGLRMAALDLLPSARRWRTLMAAFEEDYGMLAQRNANLLYNEAVDRLAETERALEADLEDRLQALWGTLGEALVRGAALRNAAAAEAEAEQSRLQALQARLEGFSSP